MDPCNENVPDLAFDSRQQSMGLSAIHQQNNKTRNTGLAGQMSNMQINNYDSDDEGTMKKMMKKEPRRKRSSIIELLGMKGGQYGDDTDTEASTDTSEDHEESKDTVSDMKNTNLDGGRLMTTKSARNLKRANAMPRQQSNKNTMATTTATSMMKRKESFGTSVLQKQAQLQRALEQGLRDVQTLNDQIAVFHKDVNSPFKTQLGPNDMRQLALVAHNHMKPAMKNFIESHSEILKKFRITGTNTTMTMCRSIFGEGNDGDDEIIYGQSCTSGPLGGDAQLAALMVLEDIGGIIFFMDPLSAHPHQADIDSLVRLANVGNVILCPNPTTGCAMMWMLRQALIANKPEMMPSFFETLESPAVADYKRAQKMALKNALMHKEM